MIADESECSVSDKINKSIMKLYEVWEVWFYLIIVTVYILARLAFINSDGNIQQKVDTICWIKKK